MNQNPAGERRQRGFCLCRESCFSHVDGIHRARVLVRGFHHHHARPQQRDGDGFRGELRVSPYAQAHIGNQSRISGHGGRRGTRSGRIVPSVARSPYRPQISRLRLHPMDGVENRCRRWNGWNRGKTGQAVHISPGGRFPVGEPQGLGDGGGRDHRVYERRWILLPGNRSDRFDISRCLHTVHFHLDAVRRRNRADVDRQEMAQDIQHGDGAIARGVAHPRFSRLGALSE